MMKALNQKAVRDLNELRGMVLVIALMIACGVATFVMAVSATDSLKASKDSYYRDYRFADVFAQVKRAPLAVVERVRALDGVETIEARIVAMSNLEIENYDEPVRGMIVSIPDEGQPSLNRLFIRTGRLPRPDVDNEVVVSEPFFEAHRFRIGSTFKAIVNGRSRQLRIVGVALSPEFVIQLSPDDVVPDHKLFGILWMARSPLEAAYDMEGAFNDIALTMAAGVREEDVIERLDLLLEPYGGQGAYGRADQLSNFYLTEEFRQLRINATVLPLIFLGVAAFLLNVVIGRLVRTQREQIAVLKAFGYTNLEVGMHYMLMVSLIVLIGLAGGILFGSWIGRSLSEIYQEFYRFPYLNYRLEAYVIVSSALISFLAAIVGVVLAVRAAVKLPPAEAMRPEPPTVYRRSLVEAAGLGKKMDQPSRMILRNIERRPIKSALSVLGIALACAIVMLGRFAYSSIDFIVDVEFRRAMRDDINVRLIEPSSMKAYFELRNLEGVTYAEPFRSVAVRLHHGYRSYRTGIQGRVQGSVVRRLLDTDFNVMRLPPDGLVLSDNLARVLGVEVGDRVQVEMLEGRRLQKELRVEQVVRQYFGLSAYMDIDALTRFAQEPNTISGAYLVIDGRYRDELIDRLRERPRVAGVTVRETTINNFYESMAGNWLIIAFFISLFAGATAFSVIYNNARIALSERSRELASLRILGLTRGEISYILIGELVLLAFLAIPVGFVLGWWLTAYIVQAMQTELYTLPMIVEPGTYAFAALIVIASTLVSALLVRRRLNRLDLIAVLKTRE